MPDFKTYADAMDWLVSLGGDVLGPVMSGDGFNVKVRIPGSQISRLGKIPYDLRGDAYECARKEAIRRACSELRNALS